MHSLLVACQQPSWSRIIHLLQGLGRRRMPRTPCSPGIQCSSGTCQNHPWFQLALCKAAVASRENKHTWHQLAACNCFLPEYQLPIWISASRVFEIASMLPSTLHSLTQKGCSPPFMLRVVYAIIFFGDTLLVGNLGSLRVGYSSALNLQPLELTK